MEDEKGRNRERIIWTRSWIRRREGRGVYYQLIAVFTLRTFALGKLHLLTALSKESLIVPDFSPGKLPKEIFFPSKLEYVKRTIEFPLTVTLHVLKG